MIGTIVSGGFLLFRVLHFRDTTNVLCVFLLALALFWNDISYRVKKIPTRHAVTSVDFPTLEGMKFSNDFVRRLIRYSESDQVYYKDFERLAQTIKNIQILDPNRPLLTLTEDGYLAAVLFSNNAHAITVWWRWWQNRYPDYWDSLRSYIEEYRPLIEIKVKPWGWERYDWSDNQMQARIDLGFSNYKVLIETDYSDSGAAQILAHPKFYRKYMQTFSSN